MNYYPHFQKLVAKARQEPPLAGAVVYPLGRDALQLALSGEFGGYLAPTLVGPERRIRDIAAKDGLNISRLPIVDTPDDPRAAGQRAVELAREGKAAALIKGSLGIEDLLAPVAAPDSGLRTESRLTHAFFLDLPGQDRGLLLTDAHLNVNPNLAAKRDIAQNASFGDRARRRHAARGTACRHGRRVGRLSFHLRGVALKEMAGKGVISGAIVDGPFTPDTALSADAAHANGVRSDIAGHLDVLVAPAWKTH